MRCPSPPLPLLLLRVYYEFTARRGVYYTPIVLLYAPTGRGIPVGPPAGIPSLIRPLRLLLLLPRQSRRGGRPAARAGRAVRCPPRDLHAHIRGEHIVHVTRQAERSGAVPSGAVVCGFPIESPPQNQCTPPLFSSLRSVQRLLRLRVEARRREAHCVNSGSAGRRHIESLTHTHMHPVPRRGESELCARDVTPSCPLTSQRIAHRLGSARLGLRCYSEKRQSNNDDDE